MIISNHLNTTRVFDRLREVFNWTSIVWIWSVSGVIRSWARWSLEYGNLGGFTLMEILEGNPIRFPKDPPPKISLQGGFRAWEQPASPISQHHHCCSCWIQKHFDKIARKLWSDWFWRKNWSRWIDQKNCLKGASLALELKWSLRRVLIGLPGLELGSREGFSFPGRAADRHQQGYNCHFFGFKPLLHLQLKSGHHCSQYPNLITTTAEHQNRKSQTYQCIIGWKSSYSSIFFQFNTMLCFE